MAGFPGFYPQQESYYDGADPWDTPFLPGGAQDSTPYIGSAVPPIQAQQEDSGFNFLPGSVGSSIYDAAKATGVRPQFAMGIANNESSFLPTAFNKTPGSTSQGLFGMTDRAVIDANDYATAHMQPLGNPDRTDPLGESLRGTNYLRMMLDKNNGDEFNAAYDFNQGMNAPDNRPAGDVYANNALNFLPGGKIQTASLKSTGPSGGFGVGGGGGGGSEDTSPSVNQGANERIKMITALQSQASDYKKKALEAQTAAYAPSTLSKGDVFGAVGVPLIATIIGAAMNGKKGAKGGALAGFQGAGLGLKVAEAEAAKKSQLAAEQAKYYNSEGKDLQNQAQSLQSQEFQAQDQEAQFNRKLEQDTKMQIANRRDMQAERLENQRMLQQERLAASQQALTDKQNEKKQKADEQLAAISAPIEISDRIITPATPLVGKVREGEKVLADKLATRYSKALENIERIRGIAQSSNLVGRSFSHARELETLRSDLISQLQGINQIGVTRAGGGTKFDYEHINEIIPSPDSFFSNTGAMINPRSPSMVKQIDILKKTIIEDMNNTYKALGFNTFKVGDSVNTPDGPVTITGLTPDGNIITQPVGQ